MKKVLSIWVLLFALFSQSVLAFDIPIRPMTYVNDYAGVLSDSEEQLLEEKVQAYEKATTNEIAVVIIQTLDGDTIENIANELFNTWGIGKEDKDNGALFIASIEDRKMRIEVGYGLEGFLTDVGTAFIQDNIIRPEFKNEKYFDGIYLGLDEIMGVIDGGVDPFGDGYSSDDGESSNGSWKDNLIISLFVIPILGLFTFFMLLIPGRQWLILYVFLIPFWGLFPMLFLPKMVHIILFGIYLGGSPLARILLERYFKKHPEKRPKFRSGSGGGSSVSSRSSGSSSSSSRSSFGGGSSGGGGSSSSW